jgi:hypothetical protein
MFCIETSIASATPAGAVRGLADADWDAQPAAASAKAKTTFFNMLPPKAMDRECTLGSELGLNVRLSQRSSALMRSRQTYMRSGGGTEMIKICPDVLVEENIAERLGLAR